MTKNKESKGESLAPAEGKRIPLHAWESAVERRIREAIERGEFDNLPGFGKPLDLRQDPNTPAEWELAFKLLKDAGVSPDWIELDKEIRAARVKLFEPFERYLARLDARAGRAGPAHARAKGAEGPAPERVTRLIADFRKQAGELNALIDLFNLKAPSPRVHHRRIRIEEEVAMFRDRCTAAES